MDAREAVGIVASGRTLTRAEAHAAMSSVMAGEATPAQLGALLAALHVRGETVDEIAGCAAALRDVVVRVVLEREAIDIVGTGGDRSNSFNISTVSSFVVAGAGGRVAKHGNRAASSACGSADVLEALGVKIDLGPESVAACVGDVGVGFMFAPNFHPAMRHAGPVRREIGIRTIFNVLGPLANPAGVKRQLLGVPSPALGEISSSPSALCTTRARSPPRSRSTATMRSPSAGDGTPSSCRFTPAGFASGPRTLKIVRIPISRRTGPA